MNAVKAEENVIKTDVLKVRNNTLIFYNTIYQISNISEIRAIDISTEKSMPQYYWFFIAAGIILIILKQQITIILGIVSLILFGYLVIMHFKNKVDEKFGLYISLNSGKSTIVASKSLEFVQNIAITLHNIMNKQSGSVNFDFSTNTINEIDASSGSVVNTGKVKGDITTNIK